MRLFIAIALTDAARAAIAREQERIAADMRARRRTVPRLVDPAHMHLTLAFIGEMPEERAEAIRDASSQPIDRPPFALAFGGVGAFPPRGAPRVLWLGVVEGGADVGMVQKIAAGRLAELGVPLEQRAYHPHLTLGRWRESRPSDRPAPPSGTPTAIARLDVSAVTLFQSRLSPKGATYTPLATAPLSHSLLH
jgi:2'-5' RNA ligase